jgi:hypothetical protein
VISFRPFECTKGLTKLELPFRLGASSDELYYQKRKVRPFRFLSSFTLATRSRRNPELVGRQSGDVDHSSANQRSAIHDGHDHDPSVVEIGAEDVLAESRGLVGGDRPTMLRNGIVGRWAEFPGRLPRRSQSRLRGPQ